MMNGDVLHFNDRGGAQHSINFITAHDGFTLLDLASYNSKRNDQPWPFGPSDGGTGENLSWDCNGSREVRRQQLRNFWTILLFSRGVPMVVAGDELARTQNGNNNPWAIDSVGTWTNYRMIGTNAPTTLPTEGEGIYEDNFGSAHSEHNPLLPFVRFVAGIRAAWAVTSPAGPTNSVDPFSHLRFTFLREDGKTAIHDGLRCVMMCIHDRAASVPSVVLLINCWTSQVSYFLPRLPDGDEWCRVIDTAVWAECHDNCWPLEGAEPVFDSYWVHAHSVVVLMRRQEKHSALGDVAPSVALRS